MTAMLAVHLPRYRLNRLQVTSLTEWSSRLQEFVDSIGASVGVVGTDQSRQLILPTGNKNFFDMMRGKPPGAYEFPLEIDALVPSFGRREFPDKLPECFSSGIA